MSKQLQSASTQTSFIYAVSCYQRFYMSCLKLKSRWSSYTDDEKSIIDHIRYKCNLVGTLWLYEALMEIDAINGHVAKNVPEIILSKTQR